MYRCKVPPLPALRPSTSAREPCPRRTTTSKTAATANQPNQTAVVPQVLTSGTYYILAHSVSGAAATAGFTITATQTAAVSVSGDLVLLGGQRRQRHHRDRRQQLHAGRHRQP